VISFCRKYFALAGLTFCPCDHFRLSGSSRGVLKFRGRRCCRSCTWLRGGSRFLRCMERVEDPGENIGDFDRLIGPEIIAIGFKGQCLNETKIGFFSKSDAKNPNPGPSALFSQFIFQPSFFLIRMPGCWNPWPKNLTTGCWKA